MPICQGSDGAQIGGSLVLDVAEWWEYSQSVEFVTMELGFPSKLIEDGNVGGLRN